MMGYSRDSIEGIQLSMSLLLAHKIAENEYLEAEQAKSPRSREGSNRAKRITAANKDRTKNIPKKD